MRYCTGATRDGRLTAMDIELVSNAGAYASTSASVLETAVTLATGCYEVPNVSIDAKTVYTNCPPAAAMRGFGANQPAFASEMQMNKLAERLGMDPVELRRRNLYRNGSLMHTGQVLEAGVGALQSLEAAIAKAAELGMWPPAVSETGRLRTSPGAVERAAPTGGKRRGVGVACGFKNVGYNLGFDDRSEAIVEAYPDHALVKVGASDVGQGSTTVLAQLAAAVLELPLEAIQMVVSDTDQVPDAGSSSASRQTYVSGRAVLRAASEAAHRLAALGANPPRHVLPVVARVTCHAPSTFPMDPGTGQSQRPNFSYAYGTQVVEVEVDTDTGAVDVLRAVAAHDVGRAINLSAVEGQIEGGLVMAQGYALMEEYRLERGIPRSTSLATFLIPTSVDAPAEIVPLVVEEPDPEGPLGAKGVGEMTMLPTPGAIAAAIHDAAGVWVDQLPITPERLLSAMGRLDHPNRKEAA
jgi:CO/xanthine dehydrogenase Mo-binding subunit